MSQYLHPKETAMLNQRKKKIKQDPIPEKKPSGLSVAFHLFFNLFFFCPLNGAGWFCKEAADLVRHTKKDAMQRRSKKKAVL